MRTALIEYLTTDGPKLQEKLESAINEGVFDEALERRIRLIFNKLAKAE